MARQSFHAVRNESAFALSSNKSATSRMRVPSAVEDVSEKSSKKKSINALGEIAPFLKEDMELRNWVNLV
jgi:hypothetical protein